MEWERKRTSIVVDLVGRLPDDVDDLLLSPRQDLVLLLVLGLLLVLRDLLLRPKSTVDGRALSTPLRLEVDALRGGGDLLFLRRVPFGHDALELVAETL